MRCEEVHMKVCRRANRFANPHACQYPRSEEGCWEIRKVDGITEPVPANEGR